MKWSKWLYWVRGEVLGLCIGIVSAGLSLLVGFKYIWVVFYPFKAILGSIGIPEGFTLKGLMIFLLIPTLEFFIAGAILAWLYGKIKDWKYSQRL